MRLVRGTLAAPLAACSLLLVASGSARAQVAPPGGSEIDALAFADPDLFIRHEYKPPAALPADLAARLLDELEGLGVGAEAGFYDLRGDRWGTLVLTRPLLPGAGVGNRLTWAGLGSAPPADDQALGRAAWSAFEDYLRANQAQLRVDVSELSGRHAVTVHEGGRLVQINARRTFGGVPVRDSFVTAVLNSGNLVLYGTRGWGPLGISTQPAVSRDGAAAAVRAHVQSVGASSVVREPELVIVPLENGDDPGAVAPGSGYRYVLAWVVGVRFDGDFGIWEALVDAQSGRLLSFGDVNQYSERKVVGGVLPVSNDGLSPNGIPDGVEQAAWPMPFADVSNEGRALFTNSGGTLFCAQGAIETTLSGSFVRMSDTCGPVLETTAAGDLDLGVGAGTDCQAPAGHSAGDTRSSRTGFYEVNRITEQARSWLPENGWLTDQLTANMNLPQVCNAFWDGATINFFRQSPGVPGTATFCRNTGEIAAVFDHEWGHGMDQNDAQIGISRPGEAPADLYSVVRLNDSCVGRGFFVVNGRRADRQGLCDGFGDLCTTCSGVREVDWMKRASGLPHDIGWVLKVVGSPGVPGVVPPGGCIGADTRIPAAVLQAGPCGQGTHCEGNIVGEAVWDLMHRDLRGFQGSAFDLDVNTTLNLGARLQYLGGGNVNLWYQCTNKAGGCIADGGYFNYLAADDDNGSLLDGTPHMTAIHAAFDRHGIGCPFPLPVDGGCAGGPATAPTATATALDNGVRVSWNAVPGAQSYWVFRADGLRGCDFGKERIAVTSETSLVDGEVANGRAYFYTVEAVGASGSCRSPASACATATPGGAAGANLRMRPGSVRVVAVSGDGDGFVDNAETHRLEFDVESVGDATLTNVRVASVEFSHPQTTAVTPLPAAVAASLASCASAPGAVTFRAGGLRFDDTLTVRVNLTADELLGEARPQVVEIHSTESDFRPTAARTFAFDEEGNLEGWRVRRGTFAQTPTGPHVTGFFLASSAATDGACDRVQSPLVRLNEASTLSLHSMYTIEPPLPVFGNVFYDRANVGLFDPETATRTPVVPDGGRLYDIPQPEPNGSCVTNGQPGYAGAAAWGQSTWSGSALSASGQLGRPVRIDVAYGTDPLVSGSGFWFDEVAVTDFDLQVPDAQSDILSIDDADPAVEYVGGWHRRSDPAASGGGYHRRQSGKAGATARVVFGGDSVTLHYATSDGGGTAEIIIDGEMRETLSFHSADKQLRFGETKTWSGLGKDSHELVIRHLGKAVYVDGFSFDYGPGPDASAARFGSETSVTTADAGEGPVISRTVQVGPDDVEVSVVVEGSSVPLTVNLLDPAGTLIASGQALVEGSTASGLDQPVTEAGTYTVQVVNLEGAFTSLEVSTARTVRRR